MHSTFQHVAEIMLLMIMIIDHNDIERHSSRFFYSLLTVPQTVFNRYVHMTRVQLYANHVQHITHILHATCSVPHVTKGQLSCQVYGVEIAFILALFHWLKPLTD